MILNHQYHSLFHPQEEETTMGKHKQAEQPSQNQSHKEQYPSPRELNRIILFSRYRFKPDSKLKEYLFIKTKVKRSYYMLMEIFKELKVIIRSEKLYDPKNPSIIMCDPDLEIALNMKDLHVTEIRDQILGHMSLLRRQNWRENYNSFIYKSKDSFIPHGKKSNVSTTPDQEAKYSVNPSLMGLLRTECEEKDRTKAAFTFEEVPKLLFKYLIRRHYLIQETKKWPESTWILWGERSVAYPDSIDVKLKT